MVHFILIPFINSLVTTPFRSFIRSPLITTFSNVTYCTVRSLSSPCITDGFSHTPVNVMFLKVMPSMPLPGCLSYFPLKRTLT